MEKKSQPRRLAQGVGLVAVQSVSCAVVVLAVLLLRLLGGGLFSALGRYFQDAMQKNALTAAIHALWEEEIAFTTAPTATTTTEISTTTTATTTTSTTTTAATAVSTQTATAPVFGAVVSSAFGYRDNPVTGQKEFHEGLDLAAAEGTPIVAMQAGEVVAADSVGAGSLGKHLTLRHADGVEMCYAHCQTVTVTAGDLVSVGQTVATVGQTGQVTGAHLHWEIRQNGQLVDPANWLLAQNV